MEINIVISLHCLRYKCTCIGICFRKEEKSDILFFFKLLCHYLTSFLRKSHPATPPSPMYLVPETTSKFSSFCFL